MDALFSAYKPRPMKDTHKRCRYVEKVYSRLPEKQVLLLYYKEQCTTVKQMRSNLDVIPQEWDKLGRH